MLGGEKRELGEEGKQTNRKIVKWHREIAKVSVHVLIEVPFGIGVLNISLEDSMKRALFTHFGIVLAREAPPRSTRL